ncbi:hypothetical protein BDV3_004004 [Batrachochytrium dendrobatidis]|uniref:MBOAT family protein n=1 Tax=Batrachochytrium dendrobatidis (strain JEL423) TaxID=403673 RepID=A0A177WGG2_BATDL|nr:hypothetical protein BDEG_22381 [Batrachochytrium dendrobatidis JEL423]
MNIRQYGQDLGISNDIFILGLCLLISFPLSGLYSFIPTTSAYRSSRHWFSIITTSTISLLIFDVSGILHLLVPTVTTYFITRAVGSNRWTPYVVFAATLLHLSWIHLGSQFWYVDDPNYIDISAPLMVLVIKLSSYAYSVYDGSRPDQEVHAEMRPLAIKKIPDFVEYLGFIFFFATFWVGPAFDYKHYYEFSRNLGAYRRIPSTKMASIKVLILGTLILSAFLTLDSIRSPAFYRSPTGFVKEKGFWWRVFLIQVAGLSTRAKLCAAWKISEAAGILTGLGYRGVDSITKKPMFDLLENINVRQVELGQCPKGIIDGWNIKTSNWLKRCVYLRATTPGSKSTSVATGLTNLISAMWHGFHAGYYLSFLSATLWIIVGRITRRYFRPFFVLSDSPLKFYKPVYDLLGFIFTMSTLNYIFMPFIVWHASSSLYIWTSVLFLGHVFLLSIYVLLETLGGGWYLQHIVLPYVIGSEAAATARGEITMDFAQKKSIQGLHRKLD